MSKENNRGKSSQEENLLIYVKPVPFYQILHCHSQSNPWFLQRCLSYKRQAKGESKSAELVFFNYKDCNNTIQATEVTENCSYPFCFMRCGSFKGLQLHLNSFHDLFEFEFMMSEEKLIVNVSVRLDASESEEEGNHEENFKLVSFCSRRFKHRQRGGGRNNDKPPKPMTLEEVMSDQDSEDEFDDEVADFDDRQMTIDIRDANTNEKIFKHIWNSFVRKHRVVADDNLPWACEEFSKLHKKELLCSYPLFWCWRVLMIKLWDIGIVKSPTVYNCHIILRNFEDNSDKSNNSNDKSDPIDVDEYANNGKDKQ